VEFWHFWGSPVRRTAVRRVVAICEQQLPNITVTEVFKPWGDIWTANIAAVAAGSGMPDVIVADRGQMPRDAAANIFENLQPLIERDGLDPAAFWPFTWQQTLYDGDSYGVPFETDVRVLFYNKNFFEQAGLDPDNPPETWSEVAVAAEALTVTNENGSLSRIGFDPLGGSGPPAMWFVLNDADLVRDGEVMINTPEAAETLHWIKDQLDAYGGFDAYNRFTGMFSAPPNDIFMGGGTAMRVDTAGYSSILNFYRPRVELDDGSEAEMQWGVAPLPHDDDADAANSSGGFALSIPRGADNGEAAWEFIKCASSVPAQVSWARDTYAIPTVIEAATDASLMADPNWGSFVEALESSVVYDFIPGYPAWGQELDNRFEQIWTGSLTPEQALEQAQQAVDAELARQ
jgi:multiple sugar transport system substrate-binding protein